MHTRTFNANERYTLKEASRILKLQKSRKRKRILEKILNISIAIFFLALCPIVSILCDGDCTGCVILISIALYFFIRR